ncbi:MAG: hypothetical protein ACRD16_16480 [Thermoanaerobaculia bacterium]
MRRIRNHPAIQREISEAQDWYEKARAGLGREFVLEIDRAVDEIARQAVPTVSHPDIPEARRALLRRFPYWLVVLERSDELVLLAVAHMRRRPGYRRDRLGGA